MNKPLPIDHSSPPSTDLFHPRFKDLSSHRAVEITPGDPARYSYQERSFTFIHLSVTGRCHARCKGCVNAAITSSYLGARSDIVPIADTDPDRDAACIVHLLKDSEKEETVVCLYGGEPLLVPEKIAAVMGRLREANLPQKVRFMLYTNGDLLEKSVGRFPEMMSGLWLVSVSIDGRKSQHEAVRPGTSLDRIHAGLKALARVRTGTILMWSTLREGQSLADCYAEFRELHADGLADQFFWHWLEAAEPFADLPVYLGEYEQNLQAIMDDYVAMIHEGGVPPMPHLNELVLYALADRQRNSSACGVELPGNYDLADGKVHACADLPPELAIGTIDPDGTPRLSCRDLSALVRYKEDLGCSRCGVHSYCGGRCPVQAQAGGKRLLQYCQLMRLHVGVVLIHLDRIREGLENSGMSCQQLYDRSAFLTPFTDVTP
jgi:uncharacterized protein